MKLPGLTTHLTPAPVRKGTSGPPTGHRDQSNIHRSPGDGKETGAKFNLTALAIVLGVLVGLVCMVVIVILLVRKRRRYKCPFDQDGSLIDPDITCKSAPNSRVSSPRLVKKGSYLDTDTEGFRGVLVRSVTMTSIPDFTLPPERIQPQPSFDQGAGISMPQFQQQLLGVIQPHLYRSGSNSEDEDELGQSKYGRLWFSMVYDGAVEQLSVTLIKIRDLPGRGKGRVLRDPFVKLFLLPDNLCRISKVKKKTLAPVYNETFIFLVAADRAEDYVVRFSVYDVDKRRIRHSLGHVTVFLKEANLTKREVQWRDLDLSAQTCSLGEVHVSLTYTPNVDKLKICILRARNLRNYTTESEQEFYIRLQIMRGWKSLKVKKTGVVSGTGVEACFSATFSFSISWGQLESTHAIISVMTTSTRRLLGHDEEYGRVVIGPFMFARGDGLLHWQDMIAHLRQPVSRWHTLVHSTVSEH